MFRPVSLSVALLLLLAARSDGQAGKRKQVPTTLQTAVAKLDKEVADHTAALARLKEPSFTADLKDTETKLKAAERGGKSDEAELLKAKLKDLTEYGPILSTVEVERRRETAVSKMVALYAIRDKFDELKHESLQPRMDAIEATCDTVKKQVGQFAPADAKEYTGTIRVWVKNKPGVVEKTQTITVKMTKYDRPLAQFEATVKIDNQERTTKQKGCFMQSMMSLDDYAALRLRDGKWVGSLKAGGRIELEEAK